MLSEFLIFAVTFLSLIYYNAYRKRNAKRPYNFPPGPKGYPGVGGLPGVLINTPLSLKEIGDQYGGMFSFDFAAFRAVVFTDYKLIKEVTNRPEQCGRTNEKVFGLKMVDQIHRGILFNRGKNNADQRKFSLQLLKQFGFGKRSMESYFEREMDELIEVFKKYSGKPFKLSYQVYGAIVNSLWQIMTGKRYAHDDPRAIDLYQRITSDIQTMMTLFFFPWLFDVAQYIPFVGSRIKNYEQNSIKCLEYMKEHVDEHLENWAPGADSDFLDKYISHIKEVKDPNSTFYGKEGEKNLITILSDFMTAATETGATTISWCTHMFALNPDMQERFFQEIKSVVGLSRYVALSDRENMPYVEAFLMEILRYSGVVPFIFHNCLEDMHFREYFFPKGTILGFNIYAVHHDEKIWGDPENFRPERFLSDDGKKVIRREESIPFLIGRRNCLGEQLARDQLFFFVVGIVQRFLIFPDPAKPKPVLKTYIEQTISPISFPIVFKDRQEMQ